MDALMAKTTAPADLDMMSVDIDGNDLHVWNVPTKYKPRLVVVEFNPSASNELYFVQERDYSLNQGASLLAFILETAVRPFARGGESRIL